MWWDFSNGYTCVYQRVNEHAIGWTLGDGEG